MARRKSEMQRAAEKAVKKTHIATVVLTVLFFVIGCVGGVIISMQLTKNDKFELIGDKTVFLEIGEKFVEPGVTVISFGKDVSDKITVGGDFATMDTNLEGVYQIVYKIDDLRWGDFQRVRTVIVGDPEKGEQKNSDVTNTEVGAMEE